MSDNILEQRRMAAQMKAEFTAQRHKAAQSSSTGGDGGTDDHMFWDYGPPSLPSQHSGTPQVAPHLLWLLGYCLMIRPWYYLLPSWGPSNQTTLARYQFRS